MIRFIRGRQHRHHATRLIVGALLAVWCSTICADNPKNSQVATKKLSRYEFEDRHMGMPFRLALYATSDTIANDAARAVFARIKQLNDVMSDYEPESELMLLCETAGSGKGVRVSDDLFRVLSRALAISEASAGAFDVTIGPCVKLWRKSRRTKKLPDEAELQAARRLVDYRQIRLDPAKQTVELRQPGMKLDLGGIAVGFAIDEGLRILKDRGIQSALIDGSGDIGVSDAPPGTAGWRIGIAPLEPGAEPSRFLSLKHAAVTTSGDAWQHVEINGTRYSHIVDPLTGLGLTSRSSVTVIAPDCTSADAYATAVCILGPERGLKVIEKLPGAAACIVRVEQGQVVTSESKRLKAYEK